MEYLSFDIECIEGQFNLGNICEFGYVRADEKFNIIEQNDILIRPVLVPDKIKCKLRFSYTLEEYKNAPPLTKSHERIMSILERKDTVVLGHAIHNDVYCVNRACFVRGLRQPVYEYLDSQILYAVFKGKNEIDSLDKIADELQLEFVHHRADEDARAALLTLKHVVESEGKSIDEILEKYSIKKGSTDSGYITPCQAIHVHSDSAPNLASKNSKRRLFMQYVSDCISEEIDPKGDKFKGKKFYIIAKDTAVNLDVSRSIVRYMYENGAKWSHFANRADIIIGDYEERYSGKSYYTFDTFMEDNQFPIVELDNMAEMEKYLSHKASEAGKAGVRSGRKQRAKSGVSKEA